MVPNLLKPLLGRLISLPNRYHYWKCSKHLVPLVRQRLRDTGLRKDQADNEAPNDFITWAIQDAQDAPDGKKHTPEFISYRIIDVNFAAIHTSTFTITNVLFDLVSSPPEKGFLAGIREEAERVLREENGQWTKAGLSKMVRIDSAIRESMRYSGIFSRGAIRKVVAKDGLTLEDGLHLTQGARLGVAAFSIHHDETIYDDPWEYDAFRFSRPREELAASQEAGRDAEKAFHLTKHLSMTTTTDTWLAFGHGRHAW